MKNILIAVVSKQTMNDDMLHTLFLKVEDIITSRPLCDVTLEPGSTTSLTPNHLLKIEPSVGLPPILCIQSDCFARQCHHVVQYAADQFWNRWVYGMLDHPNKIKVVGRKEKSLCWGCCYSRGAKTQSRGRADKFTCANGIFSDKQWMANL